MSIGPAASACAHSDTIAKKKVGPYFIVGHLSVEIYPEICHTGSARMRSEQRRFPHFSKAARDFAVGVPIPRPESRPSTDPDARRSLHRGGLGVICRLKAAHSPALGSMPSRNSRRSPRTVRPPSTPPWAIRPGTPAPRRRRGSRRSVRAASAATAFTGSNPR